MNLEKELKEFYDITVKLMDRISEQGDRLYLLQKREELLNKIKNSNVDLSEVERIGKELKLEEIDKKLKSDVIDEMNRIKHQILQLKKSQKGNQAYAMSTYGGYIPSQFNKIY